MQRKWMKTAPLAVFQFKDGSMQAAHLSSNETVTERIDPRGVGGTRSKQEAPLNIAFKITAVDHFSEIPHFELLYLD